VPYLDLELICILWNISSVGLCHTKKFTPRETTKCLSLSSCVGGIGIIVQSRWCTNTTNESVKFNGSPHACLCTFYFLTLIFKYSMDGFDMSFQNLHCRCKILVMFHFSIGNIKISKYQNIKIPKYQNIKPGISLWWLVFVFQLCTTCIDSADYESSSVWMWLFKVFFSDLLFTRLLRNMMPKRAIRVYHTVASLYTMKIQIKHSVFVGTNMKNSPYNFGHKNLSGWLLPWMHCMAILYGKNNKKQQKNWSIVRTM